MKSNYKRRIALVIIFIIGLTIFTYPALSDYVARRNVITGASNYNIEVTNLTEEEIEQMWAEAKAYNDSLNGDPVPDPFIPGSGRVLPDNYLSVLDTGDGIMGYIEIDKINVYLPIYHGTSDEVLEKGAGHIEQTTLPIGGKGNLSVITAHTGQTTSEMFDRLIEMEEKDIFIFRILDGVFTYEVDNIRIILPEETDSLIPEEGRDLATLVTCTPYGVNSHRLLVRGTRISNRPNAEQRIEKVDFPWELVIKVVVATMLFLIIFVRSIRR